MNDKIDKIDKTGQIDRILGSYITAPLFIFSLISYLINGKWLWQYPVSTTSIIILIILCLIFGFFINLIADNKDTFKGVLKLFGIFVIGLGCLWIILKLIGVLLRFLINF
jgi:hypothetical protein